MGRAFAFFAAFTGMGTILLAALLLGQVGGPGTGAGSPSPGAARLAGSIEIHAFDLGFTPNTVTVSAPGTYTVTFVNDGGVVHDLTFDDGTVINADAHTTVS